MFSVPNVPELSGYNDCSCALCNQLSTEDNPLIDLGHGNCWLHMDCFNNLLNRRDHSQDLYNIFQSYDEIAQWLFGDERYQKGKISKFVRFRPKNNSSVITYDKKSLILGFVPQQWPKLTLIDQLLLINSNANRIGTIECPNCNALIHYYGRRTKLSFMKTWFKKASNITLIGSSLLSGFILLFGIDLIISSLLVSSLGWITDFFAYQTEITLRDVFKLAIVPHFVYTLVSPNVGPFNLLLSTVYSEYGFGIPNTGITKNLQNFVKFKLFGTIIYRLTINRYFLQMFRETIPALFATKMGIRDAWSIQAYRNQNDLDELYNELSIWDKTKQFFKDTWSSLINDFGVLYQKTDLDFFFHTCGTIMIFLSGLLFKILPLQLSKNIYYNDTQNSSNAILVGFGFTQVVYFIFSTYNSYMLAKCYRNLQPGVGSLSIEDTKWITKLTCRAFGVVIN
jgi:hypothetical protein